MFAQLLPPPALVVLQQKAPPPPDSLAAAWPKLYWSVPDRGVLLLIDAEHHTLDPKPDEPYNAFQSYLDSGEGEEDEPDPDDPPKPKPTLPPPPQGGYNVVGLLPRFDCELLRFSTVSVIAPRQMFAFDPSNDAPDLASDRRENTSTGVLYRLIASLTKAQWQRACTPSGLGRADLDPSQRPLFDDALPNSVDIELPPGTPITDESPTIKISPQERAGLRLRLHRDLYLRPALRAPKEERERTSATLELFPKQDDDDMMASLFGLRRVPNRNKPTTLDPKAEAFRQPVSLVGVTTVDQLVQKIAAAIRLPLLADRRIGKLSVATRGETANAGDLLAALCRAVCGTVRSVTDGKRMVYLLTDELPTSAEREKWLFPRMMARLVQEWSDNEQDVTWRADAQKELATRDDLDLPPRREGATLPEAFWREPNKPIAFEALPVALQQQYRDQLAEQLKEHDPNEPGEPQLPKELRASLTLAVELYFPQRGAGDSIAAINLVRLRNPVPVQPAVRIPERLPTRSLFLPFPKTPEDATKTVALARTYGFNELRVVVPPEPEALATFTALAAEAKKARLGCVPVVEVLAPLTDSTPRDRSFANQTSAEWSKQFAVPSLALERLGVLSGSNVGNFDYAVPEAVDTEALAIRVKALLAVPGVTAVGLNRLTAPGYESADEDESGFAGRFTWNGGYDPVRRVDFLLQQRFDPADFSFAGVPDDVAAVWHKLQAQRREQLWQRLETSLQAQHLPPRATVQWFHSSASAWQPRRQPSEEQGLYHEDINNFASVPPRSRERNLLQARRYLGSVIQRTLGEATTYSGVVVDLSLVSLERAQELLDSTLAKY